MPEEGTLIRTRNDPRIYVVGPHNTLQYVPDLPTLAAIEGRTLGDVQYVSEAELHGYQLGDPLPSKVDLPTIDDGTVLPDQFGHLYVMHDGTRRLVPDAATALAEQLDPEQVLVLSQPEIDAIPLGPAMMGTQQLTAGFVSDLGSGHVMTTGATLIGDGHLHCVTRTEARVWFIGWTGGVAVVFVDASGTVYHHSEVHSFGIDAPPIGSGTRTDVWDEWFDASIPKVDLRVITSQMGGVAYRLAMEMMLRAGVGAGGMHQSPNQPGL